MRKNIRKAFITLTYRSMSEDFDEQDETVQDLLDFLVDWLINHILRVDMTLVQK